MRNWCVLRDSGPSTDFKAAIQLVREMGAKPCEPGFVLGFPGFCCGLVYQSEANLSVLFEGVWPIAEVI